MLPILFGAGDEPRNHRIAAINRSPQVEPHHPLDLAQVKRPDVRRSVHSSIVHQPVQATKVGLNACHGRADFGLIGDVDAVAARLQKRAEPIGGRRFSSAAEAGKPDADAQPEGYDAAAIWCATARTGR